jgi:hypothetical protein
MAGQGSKATAAANLAMLKKGAVSYACVLLWILLSATVIMFNKYLLTYSGEKAMLHLPSMQRCTHSGIRSSDGPDARGNVAQASRTR